MLHTSLTFDQITEDDEDILCLILQDNLQTRNIPETDYNHVQSMAYYIEQNLMNC